MLRNCERNDPGCGAVRSREQSAYSIRQQGAPFRGYLGVPSFTVPIFAGGWDTLEWCLVVEEQAHIECGGCYGTL